MSFVPNTEEDRKAMLAAIGVQSFEDLLKNIPAAARFRGELPIPSELSEYEALRKMGMMAGKNLAAQGQICFAGGGAYDHYVPAAIGTLMSRSEFQTAYTPYQAEVSQGTLQAIYEFQSMICALTGMDVSNASMYDGASSTGEACLLAAAHTSRNEVIVAGHLHPNYLEVCRTLCEGRKIDVREVHTNSGTADLNMLRKEISDKTAAVIVQQPNFFGCIEDAKEIGAIAHAAGALFIMAVDPVSLGILTTPAECGADIVTGEAQGLGISLSFGGPYVGIFAVNNDLLRKIPGRLSGMTVDRDGKRGFTLTLQTREQQIKREKATSNICTNQGLFMLCATIYLSLIGKQGLVEVATSSLQKAHYLAEKISALKGFKLKYNKPFFKEFVMETPVAPSRIIEDLAKKNILAGIDLARFEGTGEGLLIAVTEKRVKEDMDLLVDSLKAYAK
jgi:glycine dehydrogenase subunit 1